MDDLPALIAERIDASPYNRGLAGVDWLAAEGNRAIVAGNDIALFEPSDTAPDVLEVHFLFTSRGRQAIDRARQIFKFIFTQTDTATIFGMVPIERKETRLFARWIGGKFAGIRPTEHGDCALYVVPKGQYA